MAPNMRALLVAGAVVLGAVLPLWAEAPTTGASRPAATQPDRPVRPPKEAELDVDEAQLDTVEDNRQVLNADLNPGESHAYRYVLLHARDVPADKLKEKAHKDLTFTHLWEDPKKYRGQIVHIEGLLRQLTPYDAPKMLANEGIKTVYEGWIFPSQSNGTSVNPYCVVFTELPENIKLGTAQDNYKVRYQVSCDAYFFKRYRYPGEDKKPRNSPLFLGHSFTLNTAQAETEGGWKQIWVVMIVGGLALVGVLIGLFVGLNWWFRRGDLLTQRRLALAREAPFVEPPAENGTGENGTAAPHNEEATPTDAPPPV